MVGIENVNWLVGQIGLFAFEPNTANGDVALAIHLETVGPVGEVGTINQYAEILFGHDSGVGTGGTIGHVAHTFGIGAVADNQGLATGDAGNTFGDGAVWSCGSTGIGITTGKGDVFDNASRTWSIGCGWS